MFSKTTSRRRLPGPLGNVFRVTQYRLFGIVVYSRYEQLTVDANHALPCEVK